MIEINIIKAAINRERTAYKHIYETCSPYAFSIIKRYINNSDDHKDVLQETFARIFLSLQSFDYKKGDFKPWLRKIVVNECFQYLRKNKNTLQVISIESVVEDYDDLEDELTRLTKTDIEQLVCSMPDGYRKIFMMIAIDEFSHKEVAEMFDISVDTSRSQFLRARSWLKKNILNNKQKMLANGI
jgi:RNA polymerase sigma factor (sigma-70 family)